MKFYRSFNILETDIFSEDAPLMGLPLNAPSDDEEGTSV